MKKIITILTALFLLNGCSSLTKAPDEADINAMALKAYQEVKSKAKYSNNKQWNEMVQRVGLRIARASKENFQWEIILIDSPEVNAWCMPGGKMAVYTGLMNVVKTEGALAAVMGHEVAHATLRHGKENYARAIKSNITGLVIGGAAIVGGQLFCKTNQCKMLTGLGGAAAGFAITFFDRKFSRENESEADQIGQIYMAQGGYDPAESIVLWERMGKAKQGAAPPEFLSTHPSDDRRRTNLKNWLPQAQQAYQQAPEKYGLGQPI